jgi:hypothetical protein
LALAFSSPAGAYDRADICQNRLDLYWDVLKARFEGKTEEQLLSQASSAFTGNNQTMAMNIVMVVYDIPKYQISSESERRKTMDRLYQRCLNASD